MKNPTINDVLLLANYIKKFGIYYEAAVTLKNQAFMVHFNKLDGDSRDKYLNAIQNLNELRNGEDDLQTPSSELRKYYLKAAKIFHPDVSKSNDTVSLFLTAKQAYDGKNLSDLQAIVFYYLSTNIDQTDIETRQFLIDEYSSMQTISQSIETKAFVVVADAVKLESMSDQMFISEIEGATVSMQQEFLLRKAEGIIPKDNVQKLL